MSTYEIKINSQFGSREIYFNEKSAEEVREALKALHFRWNVKKSCWYGFADEETISAAIGNSSDNWQPIEGAVNAPVGYHWENNGKSRFSGEYKHRLAKDEAAPAPHVVNKYGVKVGDIFHCSWGWEQTNEDFFQVVSLSGASSVRVRQVSLRLNSEDAVSSMSGNYSFVLPQDGEILPACNSIFIADEEKGDLHRLIDDGNGSAFFKLEGRYYCRPYHGETVYISWYA